MDSQSIKDAIAKTKLLDESQKQEQTKKESIFSRFKIPIVIGGAIVFFMFARNVFGKSSKLLNVSGDMYLTKNFKVKEFLVSRDIPAIKTYQLTSDELENLKTLANLLQKIRDDINVPIIINSGGRPRGLTTPDGKTFVQVLKEKGYSPSDISQHMDFSAADITTQDKSDLTKIFNLLLSTKYAPLFGSYITQAILYIEDNKPNFIHLGVKSKTNNFMLMTTGKRILLANVTKKDNKRTTEFLAYSDEKYKELLA